jgi:hypothetical protein
MAHCAIRMRPTTWSHYISCHDRLKPVGWQLRALGRVENINLSDNGPNLHLTSGEEIEDVKIYLDFDTSEPTNIDGTPLESAIGCLHHDVGLVGGWISLGTNDFSEVWEQVRQGEYSDCLIDITVRPVEFLGQDTGWKWDVVTHQAIQITKAVVQFVRMPVTTKSEQAKQKRRWFG